MHFEVSKHTYFSLSLVRSNWRKPVFEGGPAFPCPRPHMFGKIHHPSQGSRSTVLLHKWQHCSPIAPFHFHCFDDNHIFPLAVFVLGLFPSTPFVSTHYSSSGSKDLKDFLFPPSTPLSEKYYYFWTPLAQTSMHPQIVLEIEIIYNSIPIKAKFLQFSHLFARNCNTRSLLIKICLNSSVKFLHASV